MKLIIIVIYIYIYYRALFNVACYALQLATMFRATFAFFQTVRKKLLSILIQFIAQVSKENVFDRLVGMNLSFKKKKKKKLNFVCFYVY